MRVRAENRQAARGRPFRPPGDAGRGSRGTALAFYAGPQGGRVDVLLDVPSRRGLRHTVTLADLDGLLARTQAQAERPRGRRGGRGVR